MFGRVSSSAAAHQNASFKQHFLPNLLPTDEEDSDEGEEAAAIAEALLGRKPLSGPSDGRNSACNYIKQGGLEDGQVCEDEVCLHRLNTSSQDVSNSVGQPLVTTSLLDRLGPPSQPASLTSVSSSGRRNHPEQADSHLSSTGAASVQSQDGKTVRPLPDDQKSGGGELGSSTGQKRPHSPRRRRNSSRSRSPVRSRHSPPPCEGRRRASLSARITLNNRRNSCSPDSMQLGLPARPKAARIPRRFSSPSNSSHYRRDPRDREVPNSSRYHSNVSSDPRRSRHHPDLHPPCKPVVDEPNSIPISNAGSTTKSPSRSIPDTPSTVAPKPPKVSVRVGNLPSYYILTPKRLYEHLTDPIYHQRSQLGMPCELKLYRYARSDCVVAELKFDSLEHARYFTQKVDRAWPPFWYTSKKLPLHSRQKNVECTVLEDRHASWPSNYETYFPKIRSVSEVDGVVLEQPEQGQASQPPHIAASVNTSAAPPSKLPSDAGTSPAKMKPKPDYYRPKPSQPSQNGTVAANERKTQPSSPPHPDQRDRADRSECPSSEAPNEFHTSFSKVQLNSEAGDVEENQINSTPAKAPTEDHGQPIREEPTSANVPAPVSNPASDADVQPMLDLLLASQNIAESADSQLVEPLSIADKNENSGRSVMLSRLHPSLTWPVLQSHFSFPNRPRHFRIFEPFQVAYGSFFAADRPRSLVDDSAGAQEGCMISFNDTDTAKNFCRVLQQNPPFQSVQIRLVDAALHARLYTPSASYIASLIQSNPSSASIIRKPHDEDCAESATAIDPANQFIQNSLLDFQNQLNWTPVIHSEMQSPAPAQMEINPLIPIPKSPFTDSDFSMQSALGCSVYPFSYSNGYQSPIPGYSQSCSSVPMNYPYNPPSHDAQTFSAPLVSPEGFNMTPNEQTPLSSTNTPEKKPDAQQEHQDRLKKILQERMAKSRR